MQMGRVVFLGKEAGLAGMVMWHDVQRHFIKMSAWVVGQV